MKLIIPAMLLPVLISGCATVEPRDCTIVPASLADHFGSEEGYLTFSKTMRRPSYDDNDLRIKLSTEYLSRQDTTNAGRLHFLQTRARSYAAIGQRSLALADYKSLASLPDIEEDRRAYFQHLVEKGDFPLGPKATPDPENVFDATPITRIPPIVPQKFLNRDNSGHCTILFDVDTSGKTTNVRFDYCTDNDLREASLKSLQLWRYKPKTVDGTAVIRKDVRTRISFNLQDECGYNFPE